MPGMSDQPTSPDSPGASSAGNERTLAMLAHLAALAGYIVPLGNILGPLVVWLVKKDQSAFVAEQAKESLNFQITMTIGFIICILLIFVVIGIFLLPLLAILNLVLVIVAAVKANGGERYRYPFSLRLVK